MWAGFASDGQTIGLCPADEFGHAGMADVADVHAGPGFAGQVDDVRRGDDFRDHGAAVQKGPSGPAPGLRFRFTGADKRVILTVEPGEAAESLDPEQRLTRQPHVHTGIPEGHGRNEGLEAHGPGRVHARQFGGGVGHEPAPERIVHETAALEHGQLVREGIRGGQGWRVLERHVDEGRHPAHRRRFRGVRQVFAPSEAGIVDMGVTVQHTGQHIQSGGIQFLARRQRSVIGNRRDFPVPDVQMPAENPIGGDQHSVPDR